MKTFFRLFSYLSAWSISVPLLVACYGVEKVDPVVASASLLSQQQLVGRWQAGSELFVFDSDGWLFVYSDDQNSRQRYLWNVNTGSLLVGVSQMYYSEQEADQMVLAFADNATFQAALDESFCLEVQPLTEQSALHLSVAFVDRQLILTPPSRTHLQDMMHETLIQQGLKSNYLSIDGALRLSRAPF